jgi:hypothetical protein
MAHGAMKQLYPQPVNTWLCRSAERLFIAALPSLDDESRSPLAAESRFITLMRITGARALKISNTRMSF